MKRRLATIFSTVEPVKVESRTSFLFFRKNNVFEFFVVVDKWESQMSDKISSNYSQIHLRGFDCTDVTEVLL